MSSEPSLASPYQLLRCAALVFVHHNDFDPWRWCRAVRQRCGEDAEECDGQNETQHQRGTVAAQGDNGGTDNGDDQSRNSLPVRCRNTDSRLGRRSVTSTSSRPERAASSSRPAISVECFDGELSGAIQQTPRVLRDPRFDHAGRAIKARQHLAALGKGAWTSVLGAESDDAAVIDDGDAIAQAAPPLPCNGWCR
jgi:hypothetical protein